MNRMSQNESPDVYVSYTTIHGSGTWPYSKVALSFKQIQKLKFR